jgi:hypothetical protein
MHTKDPFSQFALTLLSGPNHMAKRNENESILPFRFRKFNSAHIVETKRSLVQTSLSF